MNIELREEPLFHYGDHFFAIQPDPKRFSKTEVTFSEICPICDDTREVTIRGQAFECPMCKGGYGAANHISLRNWVVQEYIVNGLTIKGPCSKAEFKREFPVITDGLAFGICGRGYDNVLTRSVPISFERDVDPPEDEWPNIISEKSLGRKIRDVVFRKKSDAEQFCKAVILNDKDRLKKFNEKHGTNHKYPFES